MELPEKTQFVRSGYLEVGLHGCLRDFEYDEAHEALPGLRAQAERNLMFLKRSS